jgi:hypothetical protein
MKESKAMMKEEISFMKKKGAPKSMIRHEESEMKGMKKSGKVGGSYRKAADGPVVKKGKTKGKQVKMAMGGNVKKMRYGGKCD